MDINQTIPNPMFISPSSIVINRDALHQQGQQSSDITININNHINLYFSPQETSDDNHVHSTTTMDTDIENENQDKDEEDTDEDDGKTIIELETNDSDHDSNYQTPPTSDNDNEDNNLDY